MARDWRLKIGKHSWHVRRGINNFSTYQEWLITGFPLVKICSSLWYLPNLRTFFSSHYREIIYQQPASLSIVLRLLCCGKGLRLVAQWKLAIAVTSQSKLKQADYLDAQDSSKFSHPLEKGLSLTLWLLFLRYWQWHWHLLKLTKYFQCKYLRNIDIFPLK